MGSRWARFAVAVFAMVTTHVWGQSFNVDFGKSDTNVVPSSIYGGGAGQSGFWNPSTFFAANLKDIAGITTPVSVGTTGQTATSTITDAFGDDRALMEDFVKAPSASDATLTVQNLAIGSFRIYVYGWAGHLYGDFQGIYDFYNPQTNAKTRKIIDYGAAWPGQQVLGETYTTYDFAITAPNQTFLMVYFGQGVGEETMTSVVNGLQITQIPAPTSLALVGLGSMMVGRHRR